MARRDWYNNTTWNADIEARFQQKLERARNKSFYLKIQASRLVKTHPTVALNLLEQYFASGGDLSLANAYVDKGRALATLGNFDEALASYEAALEQERQNPRIGTPAYLEFPVLVVEAEISGSYVRALEVLDGYKGNIVFHTQRYRIHGARAIILHRLGWKQEAKADAILAMAASRETHSGFRYHPDVGVVQNSDDSFGKKVAELAA